ANAAAEEARLLMEAAKQRRGDEARMLLKQGVNVNATQPDGATALHWAAHWDDLEVAGLLIRAGANPHIGNEHYGVTPLSLACTNGSAPMARMLLNAGASANATQSIGETALMTASRVGNVDVVKELLAHGANVNAVHRGSGQTAIMWAAAEEHPEGVRALVEQGADVRARSTGGFTPLSFAARQGNEQSVRLLLTAGADVNQPAGDG